MKVKAFLMAALLLCGVATASAQSAGQFRVGVTGGMNVSNITDQNTDCRIGFNVGLRGEYNFTENWYGNLGVLFSWKGSYTKEDKGVDLGNLGQLKGEATFKQTPGYIELPLHFGGRVNLGNGVSVFGETGPYFAFGVCGKSKVSYDSNVGLKGDAFDADFFSKDNGDPQVFDCGWGLRAGVEVSNFQIGLGFDHGITKVWDSDNVNSRNWNLSVGLTYMF